MGLFCPVRLPFQPARLKAIETPFTGKIGTPMLFLADHAAALSIV